MEEKKKKKNSINVPDASSNLDFIFLHRCVCQRGRNYCEYSSSRYLHDTQGCPVSVGTSCLCHWEFGPVIRPLGLNSQHGGQAMGETFGAFPQE